MSRDVLSLTLLLPAWSIPNEEKRDRDRTHHGHQGIQGKSPARPNTVDDILRHGDYHSTQNAPRDIDRRNNRSTEIWVQVNQQRIAKVSMRSRT